MSRAMDEPQPWRFFEVLHRCGALQKVLPEVAEIMGSETQGMALIQQWEWCRR